MTEERYPGVSERVKATMADTMVMIVSMFGISYVFSQLENVSDSARIALFVFVFIAYDPFFTSFLGGTLGQKMFGLRVKKDMEGIKNISLLSAFLRYFVKVSLGVISLFTLSGNPKRKAIHDSFVGSVVVYEKVDCN